LFNLYQFTPVASASQSACKHWPGNGSLCEVEDADKQQLQESEQEQVDTQSQDESPLEQDYLVE
jgi:hypothetical protein